MRRVFRLFFRGILILALIIGGLAVWKREEIKRLLAVNSLFAAEKIVENFSHMDTMFLTRAVPRGNGPVSPLPAGVETPLPAGADSWIADRAITGLVVLKSGAVTHESYHLGTAPDDLRISWSVAKSALSMLMGIVMDEGAIASLDDPVTKYAAALAGSAYEGATIRNVLNMASGVAFDEDYLDYNSDINKMGRVLALGGTMDGFAAGLHERSAAPGAAWQYVSIDTHVLGMVIRGATGQDIATLLSEKLFAPMGLEAEPYYLTDGSGVAFVLGGLNMTTRDYARLGQLALQDGLWNGAQIVPAAWMREATRASAPTAPGELRYGYQWWIPADAQEGEFFARGIYGQYIYIDRPRGVVIAINAADRGFREPDAYPVTLAMLRRIAAAQ
ncbi:MAG: serine hydrolase [Paracoccaceae bacterium]